jgi:hypothetical protein
MSATRRSTSGATSVPIAEVVITLVFLVIFVGAYQLSQDWPFKARLFPDMISVAGIIFVVMKLAGYGIQIHKGRGDAESAPSVEPEPVAHREEKDDEVDHEEDFSMEYVFSTASRLQWASALAWFVAFFVGLYVLGVFITVPAFAFLYLRIVGRAGWIGSAIYAAAAGGLIWFVFDRLLLVPMPAGIF